MFVALVLRRSSTHARGTTPQSRTDHGAFTTQARVPGSDSFLLNDYTLLWEEAAAASQ